jgi:atypical dual specificity phosphatase
VRFLASLLFYPTLLWNIVLHRLTPTRRWWDWIDDSVLLGALPARGHVPQLKAAGVGGVINTCREYRGPVREYAECGMEQLCLPTTDFTPPTLEDCRQGVLFIQRHVAKGSKVYVHCKAGRGRSATLAMCYLISKGLTPTQAQTLLLEKRPHVLRNIAERDVIKEYAALYQGKFPS